MAMTNKSTKFILVLLLAASPVSARAEYMILGAGTVSCGTFVQDRSKRSFVMSWILGYLTGVNMGRAIVSQKDQDLTAGVDAGGIEQWTVNYCTSYPLKNVEAASFQLMRELLGLPAN